MSVTTSINCDCNDASGNRTMAQLVTAVRDALGFIGQQTGTDIRTLAAMRTVVYRNVGYASMATPTAGVNDLIDGFIIEAEQSLARRPELGITALPARMTGDASNCTVDSHAIVMLATGMAKAHMEQPDARSYFERLERYIADHVARQPPNANAVIKNFLQSAQRQLYMRYDALRTERWFSWNLTANVGLYDYPSNTELCAKKVNPSKVTWVGVVRDGIWTPLRAGIPPHLYNHNVRGLPSNYDFRQCIEVWPQPDRTSGQLVVKGHFGLEPFTDDAHTTTIDDELVFLMATANAKAHYRHPDAQNYIGQLETHLRKVIAGTHGTRRYIPGGMGGDNIYVEPKPSVPFA